MAEKGVTTKRKPIANFGPANVWFCDECQSHGPASLDPEQTVKSAVDKIRKAHANKSPACKGETRYIRIVNLERLKAEGRVA